MKCTHQLYVIIIGNEGGRTFSFFVKLVRISRLALIALYEYLYFWLFSVFCKSKPLYVVIQWSSLCCHCLCVSYFQGSCASQWINEAAEQ